MSIFWGESVLLTLHKLGPPDQVAHPEMFALKATWNCGAKNPPALNPDTVMEPGSMLSEGGD